VTSLAEMVDLLINENRPLKRALARAERTQGSGNLGQAAEGPLRTSAAPNPRAGQLPDASAKAIDNSNCCADEHSDATQRY